MLATGKIGAILVPLNIRLAIRELQYMVEKTSPPSDIFGLLWPTIKKILTQMKNAYRTACALFSGILILKGSLLKNHPTSLLAGLWNMAAKRKSNFSLRHSLKKK